MTKQRDAPATSAASTLLTDVIYSVINEGAGSDKLPPGKRNIDIQFLGGPVSLGCVCFRNFYSESVSLKIRVADASAATGTSGNGNAPRWRTIVRRHKLMTNPHAENEAQNYHVLTKDVFFPGVDVTNVRCLRIVLLQPSPTWRNHNIHCLRVCAPAPATADSWRDEGESKGGDADAAGGAEAGTGGGGGGGESRTSSGSGGARSRVGEHLLKLMEASRTIKEENGRFVERNNVRRFDASRYDITTLQL